MSANVSQNYYVLGQAPLDAKIVFKNKQAFIDYTLNNEFFAFNFYKGMLVYLQEEEILCIWEFAYSPIYEENEKILPNNFIYPLGTIYNGLDYSEKAFNLIEIPLNKSNLGQWDLNTNDEKTLTIVVDENTISNVFVPEQITQLWPNAEKISFIDGNIQGIKFQGKQIEYFEEFSLLDWDQLTYEIWNSDLAYIQNAKMKIVMIGENIDYTQYENRILANSFTEAKIIHEAVSAKNKNSIYFLNKEDSFDILIVDKFFVVKKASDFFAKKDASNLSTYSVSWREALDLYSKEQIDLKNNEQDSRLENLEGINYTWSPTNRTLTLFDREGTQLSQVYLVSLDNEGTDLRYNASTLSLELYNTDNQLLDSIPVSSFIGSVGTQLQLNSNELQLKDSQGNILSTVTFEVSNINGLQTVLDTKFDKEKFSPLSPQRIPFLHASNYFFNSPFYVDTTNNYFVGLNKTNPTEYLDVNGNIKAIGFKIPNGIATQALTANGTVYDLTTKADLVDGKVPKVQSQPSTMVMNNSTYVITFTDATGAIQTIDLPLETLFQDANYDETTKSLIVTLQDGTTRTIPLSDLVDLPEIVLATANPAVTPTTGQKVWFNTSLGKVWFNVSGVWTYAGNLMTDAEKVKLANTSGTNTGDETNSTIINKIGYTPENILNKSSNVLADKASSIKYPTVKSVYDYVQPEFNSRLKSYAYDSLSAFPIGIQTDAFFIDRELGDVYIGWTDPNYFGDPGYGGTYYKKISLDINTTDLVYYYKKTESDLRYIKIEANSSTGTVISFSTDKVYGTLTTPETGNITADVTNAKLGVTNIIIHNSGTAPTFGSEFKKLSGSGNYVTGVVNYIYCTYISTTEIIYSINQRT